MPNNINFPLSPKVRTNFAYAYARDPEAGPGGGSSSPKRIAKRLLPTRKTRWVVVFVLALGTVLFLSAYDNRVPRHRSQRQRPHGHESPGWAGEMDETDIAAEGVWLEDEEDEDADAGRGGWGWGLRVPFVRPKPGAMEEDLYDEMDDMIGSGGLPPEHGGIPTDQAHSDSSQAWWSTWMEPMHPNITNFPAPSDMFPEIDLPSHLKPPQFDPYPDSRLREIISPPTEDDLVVPGSSRIPTEKSFAKQWIGPEQWDGSGTVRRVQWEGFAGGRDQWETDDEKAVREGRRDAVRRGFAHAWQAYKDHAWGHDEVKPISQVPSNPFNNWGATIVDSLDTLLLMGFSDEYNLCRPHINQLNFHWKEGRDWSQGYVSEPPATDDDETPVETWSIPRDRQVSLPVFETSIRYLGGLLGAYDLSGDDLLLDRAKDLAEILSRAFTTESGLPAGRIDPLKTDGFSINQVSIAEVGSMSLEFMRLSQITGDRRWFDYVQRAMDYLEVRVIPRSPHKPLIPLWFYPDAGLNTALKGTISIGGLADSYYEYLIKTYKLLRGNPEAKIWQDVYEQSVDTMRSVLFAHIDHIPDHPLLSIGKLENNRLLWEVEHLSCFAGAMLGLGAKILDRPQDMEDATKFTSTCYWISASTPTGLQPENVEFFKAGENMWENMTVDGRVYHPHVDEHDIDWGKMHKDREGTVRWNGDDQPVLEEHGGTPAAGEEVEVISRLKGVPPGVKKVSARGINRPENIESIFYMYRLTGDRKWQEKGWAMFTGWAESAKVDGGMSSIQDVTQEFIRYTDNMESFTLAETFKYHFLLQSDPDLASLDDYVLNTEAHPLLSNREIQSGSQRLWHPPSDPHADLGVRGQGTDAQKWTRHALLYKNRKAPTPTPGAGQGVQGPAPGPAPAPAPRQGQKPEKQGYGPALGSEREEIKAAVQGGGKGMGGGGGDPGYRPKPPGWD